MQGSLYRPFNNLRLRPLRPRQEQAIADIRQAVKEGHKRIIVQAPCGFGKCHGAGTEVIMHDGTLRKVEDIERGDRLLGPDSKPRRVLSTTKGYGPLYRVTPVKGEPFVCNDVHVLSLKRGGGSKSKRLMGTVVNIPLDEYLLRSQEFKNTHRLWRTAVQFPWQTQPLPLPPYILGLWLGDGTRRRPEITTGDLEVVQEWQSYAQMVGLRCTCKSNSVGSIRLSLANPRSGGRTKNPLTEALKEIGVSKEKHVPHIYKTASTPARLELLAGIIDTDGAYIKCCYTVLQKSERLAHDIAFVARSVGLAATVKKVNKTCANNGVMGEYHAVNICGDTDRIPCRIPRKQAARRTINKSHLVSKFKVEPIGEGDYYGFTLTDDHLYLLRDFTVTHNTVLAANLIGSALSRGTRPMFTCPAISLVDQTVRSFESEGIRDIGVMQGDHERTDSEAQVQVASVQTLIKRALPEVHFLMLDEIHRTYKGLNERLDGPWADKIAIGLTATPWAKGMGLRWTKLIIPATIPDLIAEGFLTPTTLYVPEQIANRENITVKQGEFTEKSSSDEMKQNRIVGNVVDTWKKLGPGCKTFMFCVNLDHARAQMAAFLDSGIPFGYIDAQTDREERTLQFAKMRHGEIAGIASVGCLIAGVDEDVRCVVDAAPTKSEISLVQRWGRGIRTAEGKDALIGLDHAGNNTAQGLGLFWEIFHDHLDTHKPTDKGVAYEGEKRPAKPRKCGLCNALVPQGRAICANCGEALRATGIEHEDGELVVYGTQPREKKEREYSMQERQDWYSGLLWIARERGKSEGQASWRYKEKFGAFPRKLMRVARPPSFEVEQFDRHCRIKFAKSMQKRDIIEGSGVASAGQA